MEILRYVTVAGKDLIGDWLNELHDPQARARIVSRITRLSAGNFGDCKPLQAGIWELRIDWGPGYRVYYAMVRRECVLLLLGGDKRKQRGDISRAIAFWNDYKRRTKKP